MDATNVPDRDCGLTDYGKRWLLQEQPRSLHTAVPRRSFTWVLNADPATMLYVWRHGASSLDLALLLAQVGLGTERELLHRLDEAVQAHITLVLADPAACALVRRRLGSESLSDGDSSAYEFLLWWRVYAWPPFWVDEQIQLEATFLACVQKMLR